MVVQTNYQYIVKSTQDGEPCLAGSRIPLTAIITEFDRGSSLTPKHIDEFLAAYPKETITPSMIYEAFAYYSDHQQEIDELISMHTNPPKGFVRESRGNYAFKSGQ